MQFFPPFETKTTQLSGPRILDLKEDKMEGERERVWGGGQTHWSHGISERILKYVAQIWRIHDSSPRNETFNCLAHLQLFRIILNISKLLTFIKLTAPNTGVYVFLIPRREVQRYNNTMKKRRLFPDGVYINLKYKRIVCSSPQ